METEGIVERAFAEFHDDTTALPPLTLRGGNAVDGYGRAEPFDHERDVPTDASRTVHLLGPRLPRTRAPGVITFHA